MPLKDAGTVVEACVALVKSAAREADRAAGQGTVGAGHASGKLLGNSKAKVAKSERVGANADNSAVRGARSTIASGGVGSAGAGARASRWGACTRASGRRAGARSRARSRASLTARIGSRWRGGSGSSSSRLRRNRSRSDSRCADSRSWGRRSTESGNTSLVGWSSRTSSGGRGWSSSRSRSRSRSSTTCSLSRAAKLTSTCAQNSDSSAASTRDGRSRYRTGASCYTVTRVGVDEILTRGDLALSRGKVGDEHVRHLTEDRCSGSGDLAALRATACHLERSTVHVEFAVAELVEPSPSEGVLASRKSLWNLDGDNGVVQVICVIRHVAIAISTLATIDLAVDNLPLRILVRFGVGRDGELT